VAEQPRRRAGRRHAAIRPIDLHDAIAREPDAETSTRQSGSPAIDLTG
jgi:hypothetical protein